MELPFRIGIRVSRHWAEIETKPHNRFLKKFFRLPNFGLYEYISIVFIYLCTVQLKLFRIKNNICQLHMSDGGNTR